MLKFNAIPDCIIHEIYHIFFLISRLQNLSTDNVGGKSIALSYINFIIFNLLINIITE